MKPHKTEQFKAKYGPWALVAGGSEGLGAAFAEALAQRGLNLVLLARRREPLETSAQVLREKYPVEVIHHSVDLIDYGAAKNCINSLNVPVGLLIYNALHSPIGFFGDMAEEDLSRVVEVNIKTPLLLTRLMAEKMTSRRRGGIVLMSSLAGTQGGPRLSAYAASKAFNAILAEGLWKEYKERGIDVIASCPGAILTPGYRDAGGGGIPGTLTARQVAEQTLRALGKGPVVVPGRINKIARFVMARLLPRKSAIAIMSANTGSLTSSST